MYQLVGLKLNQYITSMKAVKDSNVEGYIISDGIAVQAIDIQTFHNIVQSGKIQNVQKSSIGYYRLDYTSNLMLFFQDRQTTNYAYLLSVVEVNNITYYNIFYKSVIQVTDITKFKGLKFINAKFVGDKIVSKSGEFIYLEPSEKMRDGYDRVVLTSCNHVTKDMCIPSDVQVLGSTIFAKANIKCIRMPSVQIIGEKAFALCKVEQVKFGFNLQHIYTKAFYKSGLKNIDMSICCSLLGIGDSAFEYCEDLRSVKLPQAQYYIDAFAFNGCKNLKSVEFGNGVYSIGAYAFEETDIEHITMPISVYKLGVGCFEDCHNLKYVDLSQTGIECLSEGLFSGCNRLQTLKLPETLREINDMALSNACIVEGVELDARMVRKIGKEAFTNTKINRLILNKNVVKAPTAFRGADVHIEYV